MDMLWHLQSCDTVLALPGRPQALQGAEWRSLAVSPATASIAAGSQICYWEAPHSENSRHYSRYKDAQGASMAVNNAEQCLWKNVLRALSPKPHGLVTHHSTGAILQMSLKVGNTPS